MSAALVIGGTGKTGEKLVRRLVEEGYPTFCANRSGTALHGATGIHFDWYDASTYRSAIAGVDSVYMIAPIGSSEPLSVMQPFIEQAVSAGVKRFVLLSSSLIDEGGPVMGQVHGYLRQHAKEWAVLRPSWFMENFTIDPHLASIRFEDVIYSATDDGVVPFIAAEDIAEVALRCLVDREPVNDALVLTGPALLHYADVASIISASRGHHVRHERLTVKSLTERLSGFGIPVEFAGMLAGLDRAIAAGAEARTTDTVARLTGRPARSFDEFVKDHADLWQAIA